MMDRRLFLISACAAGLPLTARAQDVPAPLEYEPGMIGQRLDRGEVLFLDFSASWCSTCAAQERIMDKLKKDNPDYTHYVTFLKIDWDTYGQAQFTRNMGIPRRSTLVVLKGDEEIGRLVADTREARIKALMDEALRAATRS